MAGYLPPPGTKAPRRRPMLPVPQPGTIKQYLRPGNAAPVPRLTAVSAANELLDLQSFYRIPKEWR